jgi:hypothetical protein
MPDKGRKNLLEKWKSLFGIVPLGLAVTLYLARPYLETNHNPTIVCAICDNQQDIHPPTSSHDNGAFVSLTIENTGSSATTIVEHNLSWWQTLETEPLPSDGLSEAHDNIDSIEVPIGAHSPKIFQIGLNEVLIYTLRHPMPIGSTLGPLGKEKAFLYGHMTYKLYGFPVTTEFCFQYIPAYKGLPERWTVCSVHIKR